LYKTSELLDRIGGYLALGGFVCSKLQIVPDPIISCIFRYLAFLLYLMSYGFWLLGSLVSPQHPRKCEKWYGYADFKTQNLLGATVGFLGVTLGLIAALFFPPALMVGCWLIVASNIIWTTSEYHKYRHPDPNDPFYIPEKQSEYMKYVFMMTLVSMISASALTLCIIFPPATLTVMTISTITGLFLTGIAIHYWSEMTFKFAPWTKHGPKACVNSDITIMQELGAVINRENINALVPEAIKSRSGRFFSSESRLGLGPTTEVNVATNGPTDLHISNSNIPPSGA